MAFAAQKPLDLVAYAQSLTHVQNMESIMSVVMNELKGEYDVVLADPPWSYADKCHAGRRGAEYKYSTMSIDGLKSLPVPEVVNKDSVLFMWATWPLLDEALDVMGAWGFSYRTIGFIWIKMNKLKPTPFMGMGNWTRSNSEPCLLGVRGTPKRVSAAVHSVIMSPIREHSRKPDEVRHGIEKLMGPCRRIELFARSTSPGWDAWGNEVGKYDQ